MGWWLNSKTILHGLNHKVLELEEWTKRDMPEVSELKDPEPIEGNYLLVAQFHLRKVVGFIGKKHEKKWSCFKPNECGNFI